MRQASELAAPGADLLVRSSQELLRYRSTSSEQLLS